YVRVNQTMAGTSASQANPLDNSQITGSQAATSSPVRRTSINTVMMLPIALTRVTSSQKPYSNTRRQGWKRVQASAAGAGAGGMGAHSRAWSEALSPGWSQGSAARPWICPEGPWPLVAAAGCGQAGVI